MATRSDISAAFRGGRQTAGFRGFLLPRPKLPFGNLSRGIPGPRINELHKTRCLVDRDPVAAKIYELLFCHSRPAFRTTKASNASPDWTKSREVPLSMRPPKYRSAPRSLSIHLQIHPGLLSRRCRSDADQ